MMQTCSQVGTGLINPVSNRLWKFMIGWNREQLRQVSGLSQHQINIRMAEVKQAVPLR